MTGIVRGLTVTVQKSEETYTGIVERILLNGNFELEMENGKRIIAHISEVIS